MNAPTLRLPVGAREIPSSGDDVDWHAAECWKPTQLIDDNSVVGTLRRRARRGGVRVGLLVRLRSPALRRRRHRQPGVGAGARARRRPRRATKRPASRRRSPSILDRGRSDPAFVDGPDEDVHSFVERLLVERLGDAGRRLHTGRSRNEQVSLDLRLYLRRRIPLLQRGVERSIAALRAAGRRRPATR